MWVFNIIFKGAMWNEFYKKKQYQKYYLDEK